MEINKTAINGVFIIEPKVFHDARGYFFESFSRRDFDAFAEKELGYTVVERSPGGKHGGVASVSEAGKDILRKYELLEKDVVKYAEKRYKDIFES